LVCVDVQERWWVLVVSTDHLGVTSLCCHSDTLGPSHDFLFIC